MMRTMLVSVLVALTVAVPLAGAQPLTDDEAAALCESEGSAFGVNVSSSVSTGEDQGAVLFTAELDGIAADFTFCVLDESGTIVHREEMRVTGHEDFEADVPVAVGNYSAVMVLASPTGGHAAGSVGLVLAACVGNVSSASGVAWSNLSGTGIGFSGVGCPYGMSDANETGHQHSHGNATASGGHGSQGGFFDGAVAGATDPRTAAAASLAGLAGLIALGLGKWSIARVMLLGAFSRISRPEALDHEARASIHDFIRENPGAEVPRIMEAAGTKNGQTTYHLAVLRREDLIVVVRQGRTDHHFERGRYSPADMNKIATLRNTTVRQVFETVRRMPDASVGELAMTLSVSQATVSKAVKRLQDAGLVDSRRRGRRLELTSLPAPQVA